MFYSREAEIRHNMGVSLLEIGQEMLEAGDYDAALEQFKEIVELIPDEAHGHYGLAMAYGNLGRYREGVAAINRALEIEPKDSGYQQVKEVLGTQCPSHGKLSSVWGRPGT